MNRKKPLILLAMAVMLAFSALTFVGCGGQETEDQKLIREAISTELDAIKAADSSLVEAMTASGEDLFAPYGISMSDFILKFLEGFDYSVDEVAISEDGTTATVTVTLTCKSFASLSDAMAQGAQAVRDQADGLSEAELNALFGETILESIAQVEPTQIGPITIEYQKDGNLWVPSVSSEQAIVSVLFGA